MMFRRYKSEFDYSYTLGMAPTVELLKCSRELALGVYVHPEYRRDSELNIFTLCEKCKVTCEINKKAFNILSDKENVFVIGAFKKPLRELSAALPHVVFVNPGDAGNLGTNLRTCAGFDFLDTVTIMPGADVYSPKAVRASMGAVFHTRCVSFASLEDYIAAFPDYEPLFFMLNGETDLIGINTRERYALIFGNEATGLPDTCKKFGRSIKIGHSDRIDSLNLSVAVGIAAHAFRSVPGI